MITHISHKIAYLLFQVLFQGFKIFSSFLDVKSRCSIEYWVVLACWYGRHLRHPQLASWSFVSGAPIKPEDLRELPAMSSGQPSILKPTSPRVLHGQSKSIKRTKSVRFSSEVDVISIRTRASFNRERRLRRKVEKQKQILLTRFRWSFAFIL